MASGRAGTRRRPIGDLWRALGCQTRSATAALRRPSLRLLLIAYFAHVTARKGARVAILIYAFDTNGVRATAAIAVAQTVAAAIAAPVGSTLGDRLPPAKALAIGYATQAVALGATGLAIAASAQLWLIGVLAALLASAFTLTRPVHLVALPDVARHPDELTLGNAATAWVDGLASMVGPLLAGAVLAVSGAGEVLLTFMVFCFAASAFALRIEVQRVVPPAHELAMHRRILEGVRELGRDHDIAQLIGLITMQYLVVGLLDVLCVVYVVDVLDRNSASASTLAAAIGAGSALGGMGSIVMSGRQRLAAAVVMGTFVTGLPVIALGAAPGLGVSIVLLVGYGLGKSVVTVASQTLLQRTIRNDIGARVFGVNEGLIQAGTAIGSAVGPALVLTLGTTGALAVAGAVMPIAALFVLRALGRLDARAVVPGPVFDLLRGIGFLEPLPLLTLERLARAADPVVAAAEDVVIREGDAGHLYYVIRGGVARVEVGGEPVRQLEPGDGFGEIALLLDTPRTASVVADGELDLVTLSREQFLAAVAGTPTAAQNADRHVRGWLRSDALRLDETD